MTSSRQVATLSMSFTDLDRLRRDTRLSTDKGIHLGPDEEANGYESHIVRGSFFMAKLPRELRAYMKTKLWLTSELGKKHTEFAKDNLDALKKILRSTESHEDALRFRGWRDAHSTYYRLKFAKSRYIPEGAASAGKPRQLNASVVKKKASTSADRGAAAEALRNQFGRAFSEDRSVCDEKPKANLPRSKDALDKAYEKTMVARLCQNCLSHPYWVRPNSKELAPCPLNDLDADNSVRLAWSEFSQGWRPARDCARAKAQAAKAAASQ